MAKILQQSNDLQASYTRSRNTAFLCYGISALLLVILPFTISIPFAPFLIGAAMVAGLFTGTVMLNEAHIVHIGIVGEQHTASLIRQLSDEYVGIQNVRVTYEGKTSELDMVVVGPTGVFVIETKNKNGIIAGDYAAKQWSQHKVGRGGTPYTNEFHSPVKQVGTHVYCLANHLRENGMRVYVEAAVCFVNPEAQLRLTGTPTQTPVFSAAGNGVEALLTFIANRNRVLHAEQIQRVVALLS